MKQSKTDTVAPWTQYINTLIASEISSMSRYYDRITQCLPSAHDPGILLQCLEGKDKRIANTIAELQPADRLEKLRDIFLLNGTLNHTADVQELLITLRKKLTRRSRLVVVAYNSYFSWLYRIANRLGLRKGEQPSTFLTETDVRNFARLADFEVVRVRPVVYFPFRLLGLGDLINKLLPCVPIFRWLGLAEVVVLRPIIKENDRPSLSVIVPARNEKGNLESLLNGLSALDDVPLEVIFVEGHSTDGTAEEIERLIPLYANRYEISAHHQTGEGKADAVRLGLQLAQNDLLCILDADLSMPPELLRRFYEAYCCGYGDFINGSRLVYPTEGNAMKLLNKLGNIFFAKTLSMILDVRLGDTLCGTKLFSKDDYARFQAWRKDFGDFDPFGDFELLFPAAVLSLGIIDIPFFYKDRSYGSTNIRRFYHGAMLLNMTWVGFFRIALGRTSSLSQRNGDERA